MKYRLMIISRIEKSDKGHIVVATLYPTDSACIMPRDYERITASFMYRFHSDLELAEGVSDKGKKRLKIVINRPSREDEERRALGSAYYSLLFGKNCGNDETQKGVADTIYRAMRDLYEADSSTEESWSEACNDVISTLENATAKVYI